MLPVPRNHSEIRVQHHKLDKLSTLIALPLVCTLAYIGFHIYGYGVLQAVVTAVAFFIAMRLTHSIVRHFARGTKLDPPGPFIEDVAGRTDHELLQAEFLRLGGPGAAKTVAKLPDDLGHAEVILEASPSDVREHVEELVREQGVLLTNPDASPMSCKALLPAGVRAMNPTVLNIVLEATADGGTKVTIDAIAKEGMVKQRSANESATRVQNHLRLRFPRKMPE